MSFAHFQEHASPLFRNLNLLKLTDIVKLSNIIFTHDTINGKSPSIFENYFTFHKINHQHETVNSLNSIYSLPTGSLELPIYRTESGKSSIRFICSTIWNSTLKDLSMKNSKKYNNNPFWINKINIKSQNYIAKPAYYRALLNIEQFDYSCKKTFLVPLQKMFSYY